MRLNKFIAAGSALSRRAADAAIAAGRVSVNGLPARQGMEVSDTDTVRLDGELIAPSAAIITIMLNKPAGYVVSRNGQGSRTIYELLPPELQNLQPVGRLDKDSSGLLLLTNDGQLAHELTHPSRHKQKVYEVTLDKPLSREDFTAITEAGVKIDEGRPSRFALKARRRGHTAGNGPEHSACYFLPATTGWRATLTEGRNRQIRRTFAARGYTVARLHRTHFGDYTLGSLRPGSHKPLQA